MSTKTRTSKDDTQKGNCGDEYESRIPFKTLYCIWLTPVTVEGNLYALTTYIFSVLPLTKNKTFPDSFIEIVFYVSLFSLIKLEIRYII